ncbi:MAG: hypothetical protein P4L63_00670 [Candidatus Pacebacteria bacterium]|nr:hypothetical protein [Candidatus Paceibacterota bacterium]
MPSDDKNNLNRLEELKSKLFSKNYQTKIEHRDVFSHAQRNDLEDSWEKVEKDSSGVASRFFMNTSLFKKFFFFSVGVFILALVYVGYISFIGGNTVSNNNIDISVVGNNFTAGGEALPLIVQVTNRNNSALELADLVMQYPNGSSSDASSTLRESLGTIGAGAVVNENLKPVLYGEQGSTATITFSLEYHIPGSNAIIVKSQPYVVTINSTPINISVDAPPTLSPNQAIALNVKTTLNSTTTIPNVLVKVDYPIGFQFSSATPAPSFGNNVWSLGDLAPGAEHDISISGTMVGVFSGDQKTFNISSGSQSSTDKSAIDVVFNSVQQTVAIQKPFIEADLAVNGVSGNSFTTTSKTPINATINYVNNLDTTVDNVQIVAKISGNAFDPSTINASQGFYDSSANTITWDKNYQKQLAQVNPGDSGSLNFSLNPLSLFSARGGLLPTPTINVEIDISGQQANSGFAVNNITNSSSATVKVISDVGFSDKALYYSGPFTNTGPIPPDVGKITTYTIVWTLSNTANSISNAQVISSLPEWINFVGPISPTSENLTYNSTTRQLIWNADRIPSGAGLTGTARSVSFQVSFNPSLSQVSTTPIILNGAVLTGHDDFANVDLTVSKAALSTNLSNDTAFPGGGGNVVSN